MFASNTSGLSINALAQALPEALRRALLRRAFLQSAALHDLVELIACRRDRCRGAGRARDLPDHHAGQGRDPRQGHAQLHRQPRRRVLDPGRVPPHAALGSGLRCGRRADRAAHRPPEERDLPHCRRGWSRHAGARGQHHEGDAAGRSLAPVFRCFPTGIKQLLRAGRARSEDPDAACIGRSARTSRCWTSPTRRLSSVAAREADAGGRRDPQDQGRRASASRSCARAQHPQAQFLWAAFRDMLHYCAVSSGGYRRQRARSRPCGALGFRLEPGAVRDLAGGRLAARVAAWIAEDIAAGKAMASGAVAGVGHWSQGRTGVHTPQGSFSAAAQR